MNWSRLMTRLRQPESVKTSAAGPVIAWSQVGRPKWTPRRYECLADEGYRKNVIAYRCATMVATAAASVPWLLYDARGNEIETHPLLRLLDQPNPLQDGMGFLENIFLNLEISGNAYIEAVQPSGGGKPSELYVLRSDRMKVIPGASGLPEGYEYSVGGRITRWPADPITGQSSILHIKLFHPLDDWYGLSPLEAAMLSIDQHNAAGAWNQALLGQGARPSGALVYAPKEGPGTLSDEQVERLRDEMEKQYQGSRGSGRPMILEGGLEWKEMSLSPKEMDWLSGRDGAARDIALAFGVPVQLIGIQGAQTYANMQEARVALYEETVLPILSRVVAAFDHWLSPLYGSGFYLDFDKDEISALTARRDALWEKIQGADFLSINEKRAALGYSPVPGGDEVVALDSSQAEA